MVMLATILLTACAIEPEETDTHAGMDAGSDPAPAMAGHDHPMASLDGMPEMVRAADARTQEAYRFAAANPDAAHDVPCYCGCVGLGHESSYDCYVAGAAADGTLEYDMHAANCTVCVDITQDQMRLMDDGSPPDAIRAYIDVTYAQYGPPTE
jgi:hypothetical protein